MLSIDWSLFAATAWPLLAALALGLLVRRLLLSLALRVRAQDAGRRRARVVEVIAWPASIALPLFFLAVAVTHTPLPGGWAATIRHWLAVGGILCVTWLVLRAIGAVERSILRRHPVDAADNLEARRVQTQTRVLGRVAQGGAGLVGVSIALMTFPAIRELGTTLLASAGVIGLVAGIAAKPVFGNLIAGLQIALTQPIRLDDVVIVENEWGRVEEITSAYVIVRIWDERRMVVPLQWFIEHPFQNWTRTAAQLLGTVELWLDYHAPMAAIRDELQRICGSDARWDGRVCVAQVTETDRATIQVRLLVSSGNSGDLFDLRCAVRERMLEFLQRQHPESLPRLRADFARTDARRDVADEVRAPPATVQDTRSPGAEDVNAADRAGAEERARTH
jgi:small-conductance mechanosensitive channel